MYLPQCGFDLGPKLHLVQGLLLSAAFDGRTERRQDIAPALAEQEVITYPAVQSVNPDVDIGIQAFSQNPWLHAGRGQDAEGEVPHATHCPHRITGVRDHLQHFFGYTLRGHAFQDFLKVWMDAIEKTIPKCHDCQEHSLLFGHYGFEGGEE